MDDGSQRKFGVERALRAGFESCAREEAQDASWLCQAGLLGWEGGVSTTENGPCSKHTSAYTAAAGSGPESQPGCQSADLKRRPAVCLCFEGGVGTVETAWEAVGKGTPVLVVAGTGRAADLIADYMALGGDTRAAAAGLVVRPASAVSTDEAQQKKLWLNAVWGRREELGHLQTADRETHSELFDICMELVYSYRLISSTEREACNALKTGQQLVQLAASGLCVVHWLGAMCRTKGGLVTLPLAESISLCILSGIRREHADRDLKTGALSAAHDNLVSAGTMSQTGLGGGLSNAEDERQVGAVGLLGAAGQQEREPISGSSIFRDTDPNRVGAWKLRAAFARDALALLTEWGQTSLVRQILEDLGAEWGGPVPTDLLNALLHYALVHDQHSIAALALELGANMEWYNPAMRRPKPPNHPADVDFAGVPSPWKSLFIRACDDSDRHYLMLLLKQGDKKLRTRNATAALLEVTDGVIETASDIWDDEHALLILNEVLSIVVLADSSGDSCAPDEPFFFTRSRQQLWSDAELNLFLFLLLVNRPEVARLLFNRLTIRRASKALSTALWACLMCSRLSILPDVGKHSYNLRNSFEIITRFYEDLAASILTDAFERSDRLAIMSLEHPLSAHTRWTRLDLVGRGDLKCLISRCPKLFVISTQRRFFGSGNLLDTMRRVNSSLQDFLLKKLDTTFRKQTSRNAMIGSASKQSNYLKLFLNTFTPVVFFASMPSFSQFSSTFFQIDDIGNVQSNSKCGASPGRHLNLRVAVACVLVDLIGISFYVFPILPWPFYQFIWPLANAFLVQLLHRNLCLSLFSFLEEALPVVSFIPSATMGWILHLNENQCLVGADENEQHDLLGLIPIDHYIFDGFTQVLLAYIMTITLVLERPELTFSLEFLALLIMTVDKIPDILSAGLINDEMTSNKNRVIGIQSDSHRSSGNTIKTHIFSKIFWSGFRSYISNSG